MPAITNEGSVPMARTAVMPAGINHLVLNVRNREESHRFWTEVLGFQQVGELHATPQRPNPPNMRFYSGDHGGGSLNHHDIALVENTSLPAPPAEWSMFGMPCAVNHIAITLPSRAAWLEQLAYLQERGGQIRSPGRAWHDAQPVHPRPERLRHRVAL